MRQPENVEVTRAEVENLRRDQTELLALVRELKLRLESLSEDTAQQRADQNLQMRQLESKIETLLARFEDQGAQIQRFRPTPSPAATAAPADTGGAPPPPGGRSTPAALLDAAQRDFARGNYQLAVSGYEEYLETAPESDMADDAQYWIGESYYSLEDFDRAIQEFLKVRDIYPEGNMVAAATLKIGYAFLRKGDCATARRYFETVINEYPDSNEAALARDKLKTPC
jgi:tol-pal system protein YbgF